MRSLASIIALLLTACGGGGDAFAPVKCDGTIHINGTCDLLMGPPPPDTLEVSPVN